MMTRWRAATCALVLVIPLGGCGHAKDQRNTAVPVYADRDNTVRQNGATLFLPAGSIDKNTTAKITEVTQEPPGGAPVSGFDFDIGGAQVVAPVRLTMPVTDDSAVGPDGSMLVPYLSHGQWGTELGHFDAASRTVSLTVSHLSWYGDILNVVYQGIRKVLGDWLGHFRASRPSCDGPGPQLRYALQTLAEPPVLACAVGDQNSGTVKLANNRGFYLMVNPQRGLSIHDVQISGVLDAATSGGGAAIRYLAQWHSLPLPPTAMAVFQYQGVSGGPTLSFAPDSAATFISAVLSLFAGISDPGTVLLQALGCARGLHDTGTSALGGCIADALAAMADDKWIGPGHTIKVLGITVSRALLGVLTVVLRAIPAIDMAIESRDGGSQDTIQIDAGGNPTTPGPAPTTPRAAPAPQQPNPGNNPPPAPPPPPPPTVKDVVHYDCANDNSNIGKYVPSGHYWQNIFTAQGSRITGGWVLIGANTDGGDHRARIGIYGSPGLGSPLATVDVQVTGYDGEAFSLPGALAVSPGQQLYLTVLGVGDFTAYDNRSGCLIGRVNGTT
jgi:hypothetical protein